MQWELFDKNLHRKRSYMPHIEFAYLPTLFDSNKNDIVTVESPCIRNCCLDNDDICLGCFRSLTEITQWTLVDDQTRQVFLKNVAARKQKTKISLGQIRFVHKG